jgi:hypothetical protein
VTTTWLGSLGLVVYYELHQATLQMPLVEWLVSLPEFRTEVPILVAARWPVVITASLAVVVIYLLARRLFTRWLALTAAVLMALDAHTIALSRILGHDALVAIFVSISLLILLLAIKPAGEQRREAATVLLPILAGVTAGLAILSKAPALFLIPFTALILFTQVLAGRIGLTRGLGQLLLWAGAAYLTIIVLWPAAWVNPIGQPWAVVENAFLSATDRIEAAAEGYWLVPNLGPAYYLVNGAFKLNPLVIIGIILAVIYSLGAARNAKKAKSEPSQNPVRGDQVADAPPLAGIKSSGFSQTLGQPLFWLGLFVLLFGLFMTLGGKRSPRYILPVFPPLAIIAAYGWLKLFHLIRDTVQARPGAETTGLNIATTAARIVPALIFGLVALVLLVPYAPYYFSYYSPLLGGAYTAPRLVKIGWGEGLDQVGRFLQRELTGSRVGTAYASTVAPYFKGDLSGVTGEKLDYLVLYRKQVQSGNPSPRFVQYFAQTDPLFSVDLNGIRYADVYRGPALRPVVEAAGGPDDPLQPQPIGFRPLTPYGQVGQPLDVDVIWQAGADLPAQAATVSLAPLSAPGRADTGGEGLETVQTVDQTGFEVARGQGQLNLVADGLVVSRHRLVIPADLDRGVYALTVDERPLGEIEVRHFNRPDSLGQVRDVVFERQIGLVGYHFRPTEDYISVTVAWTAEQSRLPDYTVFAQFVDAVSNERVAGIDTQPLKGEWPTSRWVKGEVVVDEYLVAVPPDLEPGYYKMIVGLYQPGTGQRLVRPNGQDHWALPFTFIWELD